MRKYVAELKWEMVQWTSFACMFDGSRVHESIIDALMDYRDRTFYPNGIEEYAR